MYNRFGTVRSKVYATSVEGALHMLTVAEEEFFGDHDRYGADLDSLNLSAAPGVALRIIEATATGWSAQAAHVRDHRVCALFIGAAAPPPPATRAGAVACK